PRAWPGHGDSDRAVPAGRALYPVARAAVQEIWRPPARGGSGAALTLGATLERSGAAFGEQVGRAGPRLERPALGERTQLALPDLAQQDDQDVRATEAILCAIDEAALSRLGDVVLDEDQRGMLGHVGDPQLAAQDGLRQRHRRRMGGELGLALGLALQVALPGFARERDEVHAEATVALVVDGHAPGHGIVPAGLGIAQIELQVQHVRHPVLIDPDQAVRPRAAHGDAPRTLLALHP